MAGELGFYVHHHGSGHATRTLAIANHLPGIIRVFTSAPERFAHANPDKIRVVALPPDVVPEPDPPPGILHYAPLGVAGIRQRMQLLADWFATEPGKLLVVDISVEIALFARLCSVPVVLVRQHGIRTDPPHLAAYESCQSVLAPFPAEMEEPATPEWVRQKTCYAGGFSRYAGRKLTRTEARRQAGMELLGRYVLVISGQGGAGIPIGTVIAAARACPDWRWIVAGPVAAPENLPDNVDLRGMVPDTFPYLTGADVVVASAGHNTVMEIAAARARLICLPEPRPFHEQWSKARSLSRLGVALLADNEISGAEWPYLLERAHRLDTDLWTKVNDETGAAKAAGHLQEMAARWC